MVAQLVVDLLAKMSPNHRARGMGETIEEGVHIVSTHRPTGEFLSAMMKGILIAMEARDAETVAHSRRVTGYSLLIAEKMNMKDIEQVTFGAALHDVGKIGIPDTILRKPGALTPQEYDVVKKHPVIGYQMLRQYLTHLPIALDIVRHHHERFDGEGYPDRLKGPEISMHVRMFSVIDAFDAITTDRPYRKALSVSEALNELLRHRESQFCPECIDAFMSIDPDELHAIGRGQVSFDPFQVNTLWS